MDVYQVTFSVLVLGTGYVAYRHHADDFKPRASPIDDEEDQSSIQSVSAARNFKRIFLPVYLLVMGSDWLQGPYIYTLYKDEKGLVESTVAALFMTGFISAAISASFSGSLADKYGRRLACLAFCCIYSLSCLTVLFNDLIILFIGRVLGGISTTLMYSVFESWMVTEYHHRNLAKSSLGLSSMFGLMTTLNSAVAVGAGLIGQVLVSLTGTKTSPFMAAIVSLGLAGFIMFRYWNENYGDSADQNITISEKDSFRALISDKRILVLGFISTCFEGSMYLFIFFWSAALKSVHALANEYPRDLPFGIIFATFMCGMMLGSLGFSHATSHIYAKSVWGSLMTSANLLTIAIAGTSISLVVTTFLKNENTTFWMFVLFEMCVGIYYPSMGYQKGRAIEDGVRAKVYGLMRIPLNVFVVLALSLTTEGDAHRDRVFVFCGGLLLAASVMAGYYLEDSAAEEHSLDLEERPE